MSCDDAENNASVTMFEKYMLPSRHLAMFLPANVFISEHGEVAVSGTMVGLGGKAD